MRNRSVSIPGRPAGAGGAGGPGHERWDELLAGLLCFGLGVLGGGPFFFFFCVLARRPTATAPPHVAGSEGNVLSACANSYGSANEQGLLARRHGVRAAWTVRFGRLHRADRRADGRVEPEYPRHALECSPSVSHCPTACSKGSSARTCWGSGGGALVAVKSPDACEQHTTGARRSTARRARTAGAAAPRSICREMAAPVPTAGNASSGWRQVANVDSGAALTPTC